MGNLVDGKYMPKGLTGLRARNGLGEIGVRKTTGNVTITAVYSTHYRNRGWVSATIHLH